MPFPLQETMRLLSSLKHRETVKPFSLHCNIFNRKLPSSSSKTHSKADLFCVSLFSVIHQLLHSWMVVLNTAKFSNNDIRYPCEPKGWGCFFTLGSLWCHWEVMTLKWSFLSTEAPTTCQPVQAFCLQEESKKGWKGLKTVCFRQKMTEGPVQET